MVFDPRQVWSSPQLPALASLGMQVLDLSRRTDTSARELQDLLGTDPQLCERLVQVANSPWCTTTPPISSIDQAVATLGKSEVTSLALTLIVQDACLAAGMPGLHAPQFWRQAVVKAVAAESLCEQVQEGLKSEYFLAGLLADVGRIALLATATDEYLAAQEKARRELLPLWRVEQATFTQTSAHIGGQLTERWGFPPRLTQGIQAQFAPLITFKQVAATTGDPLTSALALASAIGDYFCGEQQALSWYRIRELTASIVPLQEAELNTLLHKVVGRFEMLAPYLSIDNRTLPELTFLNSRAIEQLKAVRAATVPAVSASSAAGESTSRRSISSANAPHNADQDRDPLTQLFTPDFFQQMVRKEIQRCRPLALPVGVAFVQIDRFEGMLKLHGQSFEHAALSHVAHLLKGLLRSSDTIARCDQQFGILACDPTAKGMQRLADRIRGRVAGEPLWWGDKEWQLTVSVGATLALPDRRDETIDSHILTAARKAVKEAVVGEGNNVYFDSLVTEIELQRMFMSNHFRFSRWLISKGILDIPRVGKALLDFKQQSLRLGDLALRQELLHQRDVEEILLDQEESQDRFGDVAVRRELLTEDQLVGLLILQQEDPVRVAELFLQLSILEENHLRNLLKEYFSVVPWAAPLYPSADNN